MKVYFLVIACLSAFSSFSQGSKEDALLRLSGKIFEWEVSGKFDSVAAVLDFRLMVIGSDGSSQTKDQYLQRLSGGSFVHNSIDVEESRVTVAENTAIVAGKGRFTVTVSGTRATRHLSYMEVFARPDGQSIWKLVAIKANVLPD